MPEDSVPVAHDAYERLAVGYHTQGDTKPANAHLERPATRSLLPELDDDRVLDAGCGAGHLTAELCEQGASVVGLDVSREMLTYAQERAPGVAFVRAALDNGLPFVDDSFDGVVSSLAFHYVRDWASLFEELRRVLDGGWVVFSIQHPFADFAEYDDAENYHEREHVSATWDSFGKTVEVPAYRRPLGAMLSAVHDARFRLDRLLEPTPTEAYREADPERYEYEATHPNFLCLRVVAE